MLDPNNGVVRNVCAVIPLQSIGYRWYGKKETDNAYKNEYLGRLRPLDQLLPFSAVRSYSTKYIYT